MQLDSGSLTHVSENAEASDGSPFAGLPPTQPNDAHGSIGVRPVMRLR